MSETTSPLSFVARGVSVAGEPVAVHDAARRGSSLSPAQRQEGEGRLLWVTGFTLAPSAACDGLQERAMVVFQQLSGADGGDQRRLALLRDRAVIATEMSFTITDDADARTALLERRVAAAPRGSDAETVVDDVLAACLPEPLRDDVALLAVRLIF